MSFDSDFNVLNCPNVCLEIRAFLTHLLGRPLCPISYTFLARQSHFRHPSQKSFSTKESENKFVWLPKIERNQCNMLKFLLYY